MRTYTAQNLTVLSTTLIINEVIKAANEGCLILGICNGFQILTETGLLKGALLRNKNLKFINKDINIKVINNDTKFSNKYKKMGPRTLYGVSFGIL